MIRFIVFDQASGTAKRWGSAPPADAERQAFFPGEVVRLTDGPLPVTDPPTLQEFDAARAS